MPVTPAHPAQLSSKVRSNPTQNTIFLAGPWTDCLCMGGLGIIFWLFLNLFTNYSNLLQNSLSTGALPILLIFLWYPHIIASWSPLYKPLKNIQAFPSTAVAFPILLAFGALLTTRPSGNILSHWVKFASLWLGFHLSNQTYDLMLLYAKRSGLNINRPIKVLWFTLIFTCLLYTILRFECSFNSSFDLSQQHEIHSLLLPSWLEGLALIGLALSATLTLCSILFLKLKNGTFPPLIIFLPALLQLLWWIPGPRDYIAKFLWFSVFHGLQYLLLSNLIFLQPLKAKKDHLPNQMGRALFQRAILLTITGLVVFKGLPLVASMLGTPLHLAMPAIINALIMHHCFVDGALSKPRDAEGANLLSPSTSTPSGGTA